MPISECASEVVPVNGSNPRGCWHPPTGNGRDRSHAPWVRPTIVHFARAGATVGTHTSHPAGVIQVEGGTAGATLQGEALACLSGCLVGVVDLLREKS